MALSMHDATAPVFDRLLGNLLHWLDKAEAHAQARGFDPAQYLTMKLAPDMLPLARQILIACDVAKGAMARLAGREVPQWADTEQTMADWRARIERTRAYVRSFAPADLAGGEAREIVLPMRQGEPLRFSGVDYLRQWALPNFYFHATTSYALLRHAGVELGKRDFLG